MSQVMSKVRKRGETIRQFILDHVEAHPTDVATLAAQQFGVTRQAINKHIKKLLEQRCLILDESSMRKVYKLHPSEEWQKSYWIRADLEEDVVWRNDIKPLVQGLPDNVAYILQYGCSEILNNAIEHSSGECITVALEKNAAHTEITILDDGVGIFTKIQLALSLHDERHAVLELTKGKLTTDPENHSGEGIFFCSRMFDYFATLSGGVCFAHEYGEEEDWIFDSDEFRSGTSVRMRLNNNTSRTAKQVFMSFATGEDHDFGKTVVPVRLAQYGDEKLISRSQARRLLARIDRFKVVVFDFLGVEIIGQAFADEVFRVFRKGHPGIRLMALNANEDVQYMIDRVESNTVER